MKRQIGSLLIAFMMVFAMMPAMAFAEAEQGPVNSTAKATAVDSGVCGDNVTWVLDSEGTLTISGTGDMFDYTADLSAPWADETFPKIVIEEGVTSIGAYAFDGCRCWDGSMSVGIPDTVTKIGEYAFNDCSLEKVLIPSTVRVIEEGAFKGNGITELIIEEGVEKIGQWAFNYLYLNSVTIPKSVIEISPRTFSRGIDDGKQLFYYVYKDSAAEAMVISNKKPYMYADGTSISGTYGNLSWIIDGNTLTVDVQGKMLDFKNTSIIPWGQHSMVIKEIQVVGTPENIGANAFCDMWEVERVTLPETVTSIGESAFEGCIQLKDIELPARLEVIGDYAFDHCESLDNIKLPGSVTHLGNCAFWGCDLKELVIPYKVTSLVLPENHIWGLVYGNDDFEKLVIMNRKCKMPLEIFESDSYTVYGFDGSTAEIFALENGLEFVPIDDTHEHELGEVVVVSESTCIKAGIEKQTCMSCGEELKKELPLAEHKSEVKKAVAPTCTTEGLTAGKHCSVCGEILVAQQTVQATGHTPGSTATCTTAQVCTVCDVELTPATGHSKVNDAAKPATAKVAGVTAGSHCAICKEVFVAQKAIPKIKTVTLKTAKYTYDGKAKKPAFTVKDTKGKILKQGTDYTIKYTNNKGKVVKTANVGTYKAVVTFKGNYSGSASKEFVVNPKAPVIKVPVAAKKALTVKWGKVAKQATGYEVMVATNSKFTKGKKTVKVTGFKTTSKKITKLKAKTKYYVKVRTYTKVSGKTYYSAWSKVKSVKTK